MQFYIEREPIGRCGTPALNHSQIRHRVKRRIHLDHLELLRVPTEPLMGAHPFGIPMLNKARIGPAGRSDKNFASARMMRRAVRFACIHPFHFEPSWESLNRMSLVIFAVDFIHLSRILSTRGGAAW